VCGVKEGKGVRVKRIKKKEKEKRKSELVEEE